MNLMVSISGEPEQLKYLPEISELGAGIELGGYGFFGVQSEGNWQIHAAQHAVLRVQFDGPVAIHGPFIGIEYNHIDHLIREVVNRRLDMTFETAVKLHAGRVVLHSGFKPQTELFHLEEAWLAGCIEFWQKEILRWADAGIEIVIENELEKSPDLLVRLVDEVSNPSLGLCFDIGHQNLFSELDAPEWVRRMDKRLYHIHLHDNDRSADSHWPLGRGTIDFEPFFTALQQHAPQATISLEVKDEMDVMMRNLRMLVARFG